MTAYTRDSLEREIVQAIFWRQKELNTYAKRMQEVAREWKRLAKKSSRAADALPTLLLAEAVVLRRLLLEHHNILVTCGNRLLQDAQNLLTTSRTRTSSPQTFSDLAYPDFFEVEDSLTNATSPYKMLEEIPGLEKQIEEAKLALRRAKRKAPA